MLAFDRHPGGGEATLVLLHSLALDRSAWDRFRAHVPRRYDVIVPDLPNHAGSAHLASATIEQMAEAVAELVRTEVPGPAIVVGMSLGGCVAQALAAGHPDLVRGLGLLDTTAWYGPTAEADWEWRAQRAASQGLGSLAEFQLARWFTAGFHEAHPEVGDRLLDVFRANDVERYVATCRAMGAADLREAVAGIAVPTSIVVGAEDTATPPGHAWDLYERIDGAGLHVVPACSHLSAIERPEVVAALLELDLFARA